jgi:hypothetical protein
LKQPAVKPPPPYVQFDMWSNLSKYGGTLISIDPGINIGWAVWDFSKKNADRLVRPTEYGWVQDPGKGRMTWEQRANWVIDNFTEHMQHGVSHCRSIIEMPQMMEARGAMVTARSGSLVKLTMMTGRIQQLMYSMGSSVELVEVRTWKGQMSKTATDACLGRRFGQDFLEECKQEHERDAVALGLWVKGHFQGQG